VSIISFHILSSNLNLELLYDNYGDTDQLTIEYLDFSTNTKKRRDFWKCSQDSYRLAAIAHTR